MKLVVVIALFSLVSMGCEERALRGKVEKSPDGQTYLAIDEDNGPDACDVIRVDGKPWPAKLHQKVAIAPGKHTITCAGEIGFEVKPGTTFRFDDWGP